MKTKSSYKKAKKRLDNACKALVKHRDIELYNGICPLCEVRKIQCWYHFIPCGDTAIRWHLQNSCGACNGCNCTEYHQRGKVLFTDKIKARHAEMFGVGTWQHLEDLARIPFKRSAAELIEMAIALEGLLAGGK